MLSPNSFSIEAITIHGFDAILTFFTSATRRANRPSHTYLSSSNTSNRAQRAYASLSLSTVTSNAQRVSALIKRIHPTVPLTIRRIVLFFRRTPSTMPLFLRHTTHISSVSFAKPKLSELVPVLASQPSFHSDPVFYKANAINRGNPTTKPKQYCTYYQCKTVHTIEQCHLNPADANANANTTRTANTLTTTAASSATTANSVTGSPMLRSNNPFTN
ncbi:hypothetical protein LT330_004679 [Penicillium expansum]|nr:hypothetical protein LT330_004679 [Penicillium expansum]